MFRRPLTALALVGLAAASVASAASAAPKKPVPTAAAAPSAAPAAPGSAAPEVVLPSTAPTAAAPRAGVGEAPAFVYLRDRYRRDDQGAALRKPILRLAELDYILGTWNTHIFTPNAAHGISRDFGHTTYVFVPTMNDRWILGTDAKNTEFLYFTYDPAAKHWVYDDIKGFPSYGISYAEGPTHRLAFDSVVESALGDERHLRTTLTYVDKNHFTLLDEEETPDDAYTPVVEFDFSRK